MDTTPFLHSRGICPICSAEAEFVSPTQNLRSDYRCTNCNSAPRERAIIAVLEMLYPNWRCVSLHEGSPMLRGASAKLKKECPGYSFSQYDPSIERGTRHPTKGFQCQDLERLTFESDSFDLMITQDVFEHLFRPDLAIREIARVLKPGGAHIMTVPLVNRTRRPSKRRASLEDDQVVHHAEPQYHGNPVSANGSLVTVDWGYDILAFLQHHSGMPSSLFYLDDIGRGLRAPLMEVVVSMKVSVPTI